MEELDWTESIKDMQRNWIGKSKGRSYILRLMVMTMQLDGIHDSSGYVVRRDLLRAWRLSMSLSQRITTAEQKAAVEAYQEKAARKSDLERTDLGER